MESLWCIHLNEKEKTFMTGFVVQGYIYQVPSCFDQSAYLMMTYMTKQFPTSPTTQTIM